MNTKWTVIALAIIVILGGGAYLLFKSNNSSSGTLTPTQSQTQVSSPTSASTNEPTAMVSEGAKKSVTVTLTSSGFSPTTITIDKGTTVVWKNESGQTATVNSDPHPIHTDFPPLNLGEFGNDGTLSLTFTASGTHGYHNHLNPSERGTVIVK